MLETKRLDGSETLRLILTFLFSNIQTLLVKMQLCSFNADCFWWTSSFNTSSLSRLWFWLCSMTSRWIVCVHVFPPACWTGRTLFSCFIDLQKMIPGLKWCALWRLVTSQLVDVMTWWLFLWSFSCFSLLSDCSFLQDGDAGWICGSLRSFKTQKYTKYSLKVRIQQQNRWSFIRNEVQVVKNLQNEGRIQTLKQIYGFFLKRWFKVSLWFSVRVTFSF